MLKIDDENNIYLTRGDNAIIDVIITNEDEEIYTPAADESIIFTLRKIYGKGEELIKKTAASGSIEFNTNDTKNLSFGIYKYDIVLFNSTAETFKTIICEKEFEVAKEVHDFEYDY